MSDYNFTGFIEIVFVVALSVAPFGDFLMLGGVHQWYCYWFRRCSEDSRLAGDFIPLSEPLEDQALRNLHLRHQRS